MALNVALYQPEIPPNTGNIMRLCANTATALHLIHPLGFRLDEAKLRRAGMDYREYADVTEHDDFDAYLLAESPGRIYAFSRSGTVNHTEVSYGDGDVLLFGPESVGLPDEILARPELTGTIRIPMVPRSRSLNLANSVAIGVYEAARQRGFPFAE